MKLIIKSLIVISGLLSGIKTLAQADISMATHWYNRANYNPASIARTDYIYLFSNYRQQWMGIDGAPKVYNIQGSEYIHKLHSAFGISFISDKIGVTQSYNSMFSYAFRLSANDNWSLSMGLSGGLFAQSVDGSLFDADYSDDPVLYYDKEKIYKPDANMGFEFQNRHFIMGLSSTHLMSIGNESDISINSNHRYGYLIYKNDTPQLFNYSLGIQAVNRNSLTIMEGNACVRIKRQTGLLKGAKEVLDIGLTYRSTRQLTVLLGLNLSSNIKVGYAYDQSFRTGLLQNGTHEIMIEYRIVSIASTTRTRCGNDVFWYR